MKIVYTGLESSGKTLFLANTLTYLLKRNIKWYKKYGFLRQVRTNIEISEEYREKYKEYIVVWKDMKEILYSTGCDILWDEISSDFSALKKEPLPRNVNRWLRQGAKQGVDIYAIAQEFHDIHLDFRRRVQQAWRVRKLFGSDRGGDNKPKVNLYYGICYARRLIINPYNELCPEMFGFPKFIWISKRICKIFDTYQIIKGDDYMPLEHVERKCETCNYKKVTHR